MSKLSVALLSSDIFSVIQDIFEIHFHLFKNDSAVHVLSELMEFSMTSASSEGSSVLLQNTIGTLAGMKRYSATVPTWLPADGSEKARVHCPTVYSKPFSSFILIAWLN